MANYTQGDVVRVSVVFAASNGVFADPTTIVVRYKTPTGTTTAWTYGVNSEVVKDAVGKYRADISVTAGGIWNFRWEGTGVLQGAAQGTFEVTATNA